MLWSFRLMSPWPFFYKHFLKPLALKAWLSGLHFWWSFVRVAWLMLKFKAFQGIIEWSTNSCIRLFCKCRDIFLWDTIKWELLIDMSFSGRLNVYSGALVNTDEVLHLFFGMGWILIMKIKYISEKCLF